MKQDTPSLRNTRRFSQHRLAQTDEHALPVSVLQLRRHSSRAILCRLWPGRSAARSDGQRGRGRVRARALGSRWPDPPFRPSPVLLSRLAHQGALSWPARVVDLAGSPVSRLQRCLFRHPVVDRRSVGVSYLARNEIVSGVIGLGSIVFVVIYMMLALKVVYGGTSIRALIHTAVILSAYWLATIVVTGAIIAPVLFWRRK